MRKRILPLLGLLCSLSPMAARANDSAAAAPEPGKLVVHEWGTFTGFAGADGRHLPFRADIGVGLPSFVLTRSEQADRFDPGLNSKWLDLLTKDETVALQRMETPVVYFYTDAPREVEARVEFPKGMLTEFYPPVRSMTPAFDARHGRNILDGTSLDWGRIRITPAASPGAAANVPKVEGEDHYGHARETDAAIVRFSDRPGEAFDEHFLFYRGLGNFELPVTLTASGNDRFVLFNASGAPIASAFLVRIENGQTRFSVYRNIDRRQEMKLPSKGSTTEALGNALVEALVAEGLYEKEARAMVKTWASSWFGAEGTGTRLLYTVPPRVTDTLLPLRISPTPDETVRVLVGRIDILTPEQEEKLGSLFAQAGDDGAIPYEAARELRSLGRFLHPACERVAKLQAWRLAKAINAARATDAVRAD